MKNLAKWMTSSKLILKSMRTMQTWVLERQKIFLQNPKSQNSKRISGAYSLQKKNLEISSVRNPTKSVSGMLFGKKIV